MSKATKHNPEEAKEVKRYIWEYKNFLQFVKDRKPGRAIIYAKSLGIDRRTYVHWMSQPELRDALSTAVDQIVEEMQRAGSGDWKMWRELLKLMDVDVKQEYDITSGGEKLPTPILGGLSQEAGADEDTRN